MTSGGRSGGAAQAGETRGGLRLLALLGALCAVALMGAAIWRSSEQQALAGIAQKGRADLALASDRITSQLKRYQELAVLMADHPVLAALAGGGAAERDAARALLTAAADKTAALDLAFADPSGRILARATRGRAAAQLDLRRSDYFARAMQGALGTGHGAYGRGAVDMPDPSDADGAQQSVDRPQRAYFYAAPQFAPQGHVAGALVVVVNIDMMEWDWIGGNPAVYFLDEAGEVFMSNRRELLFWREGAQGALIAPQAAEQAAGKAAGQALGRASGEAGQGGPSARHVPRGGYDLWRLEWGPYLPARAMALSRDLPVIGLRAVAMVDAAPARRIAWLQTGVFLALCFGFAAMLVPVMARRRVLARANAQLERRVARRTRELSGTNAALRREVAERIAAEAALKQAQAELVQAEKLSALGQMSAGISHELNQPLMAIQQFAENGALLLQKGKADVAGENLGRISALAARAARIIKNLRAFARNESEPVVKVDLVQVIDTAVEMTQARRESDGVVCDWQSGARAPIYVRGGEVRLVQVFVNLITNAADAMSGTGGGRIEITIEQGARLKVRLRDTGPGIKDPEKIFEPFYSTKTVGDGAPDADGMGLGLSISYGLVQSFGGQISGANAAQGGAVFTVELEQWQDAEAAA